MGRSPPTREVTVWKWHTCSPWRDAPFRTARIRLIRWAVHGTWERILTPVPAAVDGADDIGWTVSVESTVCRAHQHFAGARKKGLQVRPDPSARRLDAPAAA